MLFPNGLAIMTGITTGVTMVSTLSSNGLGIMFF